MAMEYFIVELQKNNKVQHGSTFSYNEAQEKAGSVKKRTGNPVTVIPEWIPENQIDDFESFTNLPITAQEFYEEVHGKARGSMTAISAQS